MYKKFDIGIFGYTMGDNYGGIATYYALYKYIQTFNKNICIIPPIYDQFWCQLSVDFFKTHCKCLKKLKTVDYHQYNEVVNTFLLGSDQMWNGNIFRNGWRDTMYLNFVKPGHKKIAYGVSYGVNYPTCLDKDPLSISYYHDLIQSFDYISHRENDGCKISRKWFKRKDTIQVVDPVFLIHSKLYDDLINEIEYEIPSNNLLFYVIGQKLSHMDTFHKIAKKLNMKESLILNNNIKQLQSVLDRSIIFDNELPLNPPDNAMDFRVWLRYMRDSEKILTSSFHGICFAVIFRKNFVCFENHKKNDTRKETILEDLGLRNRMISEYDVDKAIELYNTPIDWESVYEKLNKKIRLSKRWLKNALL